MTEEKKPTTLMMYQELFDNLKKGIYTSTFDYHLIENLQQHLAEITAFQDNADLPQEIREEVSNLFWGLHVITKQILDFQKNLIIIPGEEKPKLTRVK